jgi:hypothetical protein
VQFFKLLCQFGKVKTYFVNNTNKSQIFALDEIVAKLATNTINTLDFWISLIQKDDKENTCNFIQDLSTVLYT